MDPLILHATLPVPPGINRSYGAARTKGGKTVFYKTAEAKSFAETATVMLKSQGWKPLTGKATMVVECRIFCSQRFDVDAPIKQILDAVASVTGLDDAYVTQLHCYKTVAQKKNHRLELRVFVIPQGRAA